jgi:hypothetical protein
MGVPVLRVTVGLLVALVLGCATLHPISHGLARAQVLEVEGRAVRIALGGEDGIRVGQELVTYQSVLIESKSRLARDDGVPEYRTERTGRLRVSGIIDAHHARAEILEGDVKPGHVIRAGD